MPNRINKASLPPNLCRLQSMIFSNLMDRTTLCRTSDRSWKKSPIFAGFLAAIACPSFSHVIVGKGFPEALQRNVTVSVSFAVLFLGTEVKFTGTMIRN